MFYSSKNPEKNILHYIFHKNDLSIKNKQQDVFSIYNNNNTPIIAIQ